MTNETACELMAVKAKRWLGRQVHIAERVGGYWKVLVCIDGSYNWFRLSDLLKIPQPNQRQSLAHD